jgi:hypothetical protein
VDGQEGLAARKAAEYYFDNILKSDHLLRIFIFMVLLRKQSEFGMGEGVISLKRGVDRPQKDESTFRPISRAMILFQLLI